MSAASTAVSGPGLSAASVPRPPNGSGRSVSHWPVSPGAIGLIGRRNTAADGERARDQSSPAPPGRFEHIQWRLRRPSRPPRTGTPAGYPTSTRTLPVRHAASELSLSVQARRALVGRADDTGLCQAVTSRPWRRRSCPVTLDFQTFGSAGMPADARLGGWGPAGEVRRARSGWLDPGAAVSERMSLRRVSASGEPWSLGSMVLRVAVMPSCAG